MSIGQYLSLEEARKKNKLARFAKEHPSIGDKGMFNVLFKAMVKTQQVTSGTLKPETCEDYNETQTQQDI